MPVAELSADFLKRRTGELPGNVYGEGRCASMSQWVRRAATAVPMQAPITVRPQREAHWDPLSSPQLPMPLTKHGDCSELRSQDWLAIENRTLHGQLRQSSPKGLEAEGLEIAGDELALTALNVTSARNPSCFSSKM